MEVESSGANSSDTPKAVRKKSVSSKTLFVMLAGMGVLIIGLVIAIAVVKNLPENNNQSEMIGENGSQTNYYSNKTDDEKIYEQLSDRINSELQNIAIEDSSIALSTYEGYINSTDNENVKDMLRVDYYQTVMVLDTDKSKKDEVIDNLLEIDNRLKDINTAATIVNAGNYYGDEDLVMEYQGILKERQNARGFDLNMETEG